MLKKLIALVVGFLTLFTTNKFYPIKLPDEGTLITTLKDVNVKNTNYQSCVLIEANTNKVLQKENANYRLPMASMTKVMSLIIIYDALSEGRINKNQELVCSENAKSMGGSQIFLGVGESMIVTDLLKSVCIASANDATVMLAEAISGSEELFVSLMNKKANELGLKDTMFSNCTGLPTKKAHYTSAYDMAVMSSYLINKYPEVLEYSSKYEDYIRVGTPKQFWLVNTNKLVKSVNGIDGLKTGWTEEAGYCITCTMKKDNMRLISVVMGANTVDDRTNKTLSLLNYGFSNYQYQVLIPKNTIVDINENVLLSPVKQSVITAKDFGVVLERGKELNDYQTKIVLNRDLINNYVTENIGTAYFYKDGEEIGQVSLNILEKTTKTSFMSLLKEVLKKIFIY